jgi:hypothetical protein
LNHKSQADTQITQNVNWQNGNGTTSPNSLQITHSSVSKVSSNHTQGIIRSSLTMRFSKPDLQFTQTIVSTPFKLHYGRMAAIAMFTRRIRNEKEVDIQSIQQQLYTDSASSRSSRAAKWADYFTCTY